MPFNKKSLENLKPANMLSTQDRRKLAKAGGEKSVETRRRKKMIIESMNIIFDFLMSQPNSPSIIKSIKQLNLNVSNKKITNFLVLFLSTYVKTINSNSVSESLRFIEFLMLMFDSKPAEKVEVINRNEQINELQTFLIEKRKEINAINKR